MWGAIYFPFPPLPDLGLPDFWVGETLLRWPGLVTGSCVCECRKTSVIFCQIAVRPGHPHPRVGRGVGRSRDSPVRHMWHHDSLFSISIRNFVSMELVASSAVPTNSPQSLCFPCCFLARLFVGSSLFERVYSGEVVPHFSRLLTVLIID